MKVCPDCLARYPADQVRCATAQHARLLALSDLDDARVGALVDARYLLLGRLGEGAMGIVYRAWQRSTAREVALKVLPVDPAAAARDPRGHAEIRARFRREVQLAARIESAYVARVHDSGELPDGGLYYAMEKVAGTPLDRVLEREGPLQPARVLRLGRQLGQALSVVHALGLVHRDIKPANLMLLADAAGKESLKLVDFGIARAFEVDVQMGRAALTNLTIAGTVIGSFAYMAPEQLAPRAERSGSVGPAADVYAAGVTLYELLTGDLPYPGPTAPAFALQHQSAPIPSAAERLAAPPEDLVVRGLDHVIGKALAKDPSARLSDGAALSAALAEVVLALDHKSTDKVANAYSPDDTIPDEEPEGALAGALDPGTLRGISAADVRLRVQSVTLEVERRRRFTKGRIALALALVLGLTTVVWDLVGTLPR